MEYKTWHDWVGKVIHWELCKKFKFDHTYKWYMHNQAPVLENDTHKLLWDFEIPTDPLISARSPDLIIINNKKRTCKIVNFAVPADHRIKLKECEKKDKYLARELIKLWIIKVTNIPIVSGAFGTVTKWLLKGLEDLEVETIQTTALLRTARILRRILETWGDLLSLKKLLSLNCVLKLNGIVWNRTVYTFNCMLINDCLIVLLVIHSNTWNHLTLLTKLNSLK